MQLVKINGSKYANNWLTKIYLLLYAEFTDLNESVFTGVYVSEGKTNVN